MKLEQNLCRHGHIVVVSLILAIAQCAFCLAAGVGGMRTVHMYESGPLVSGRYGGIVRDGSGMLWVGTERGLVRFDGNSQTVYRHDDKDTASLSDNRVLTLMCDSRNRIWIATACGLNVYDRGNDSFGHVSLPSQNYGGYVEAIAEQPDGTITFIVSGKGLHIVNEADGALTGVFNQGGISESVLLRYVVTASDGRLFLASLSGKVYVTDGNSPRTVNVCESYISGMIADAGGKLIVSAADELYRVDPDNGTVTRIQYGGIVNDVVDNLTKGVDGRCYFSTRGGTIHEVDPQLPVARKLDGFYSSKFDVSTAEIGSMYADSEGNLWIGCDSRGIAYMPVGRSAFSYRDLRSDFPEIRGPLQGFAVCGKDVVIALDNGVVGVLDSDGHRRRIAVLPGSRISSVTACGDDRVLVGIDNHGVWMVKPSDGAVIKVVGIEGKYPAVKAYQASTGDIFIGLHGYGVYRHNPQSGLTTRLEHNPEGHGLSNPYVTSIREGGDRRLWFGLYGGLACYDLKADTFVNINQLPFVRSTTFAVEPRKDGSLLVGTSHGLFNYHPGKFLNKITTADGLADMDVRTIVSDRRGGRWIGTMQGLSYMAPGDTVITASYYGGNGMYEKNFRQSSLGSSDGRVWMCGDYGLTVYNPDSVPQPGFDRPVRVTGVYLNNRRLGHSADEDGRPGLRVSTEGELEVTLPYGENGLRVLMSTMDFRDASNVRYCWRIDGGDWYVTEPGMFEVNLPNLDCGTHNVEIKAQEGNIDSEPVTMCIEVMTPWYMTWWAHVLYVLLIAALVVLVWVVLRKRRAEQLNDERIKFFVDVTHDIRSPVTLILSPLSQLMRETADPRVRMLLHTAYRNGQRVLNLVNQLLDLRRLDRGKLRLHCRPTDIRTFVGELVEMFRPQARDKGIHIECECTGNLPDEVSIDRENCDKILVNLISNAIKYTGRDGRIDVKVSVREDERLGRSLSISILDTGIGLGSKKEAQIFQRFYRGDDVTTSGVAGFGIGLDLCRRLVRLHHGHITGINRRDGVKGSEFTFVLPLSPDAYDPGELSAVVENEAGETSQSFGPVSMPLSDNRPKGSCTARILLVDDDAELRDYLAHQMSRSYSIDTACDGSDAYRKVCEKEYDVIVSDVKMPVMDGLTLLRQLRGNAATNHVPVILLSSMNDISDRIQGWERGADGYIGKPFHYDELDSMVRAMVEGRLRLKGKFSGAQDCIDEVQAPEVKTFNETLRNRIVAIVESRLADSDLNVETLSRETGMSRGHLHRKMKEILGMTPSDFIRNVRLKRACDLLSDPEMEITQVAYSLGYTSQPHFSTAFKKFTGYSPTEYRERRCSGKSVVLDTDKNAM